MPPARLRSTGRSGRARPFSTYLFDLDGTLIDSTALIMASFRHTMRTHLGDVPSEQEWLSGFGTPLRTQLARFAQSETDDDGVEALAQTYIAYQRAHHDQMVTPFPEVASLVETLREDGVRLGIVTSKNRESMRRGLEVCGLGSLFEMAVTTDDVTDYKPHPAPVRTALARLEVDDPSEAIFIGDSPHDVAAGRAAGVWTAAALWGPFTRDHHAVCPPHAWLTRPAEVLEVGDVIQVGEVG